MFCENGVLKNFKFIKNDALAQVFSCEFYDIFENTNFCRIPLIAASERVLMVLLNGWMIPLRIGKYRSESHNGRKKNTRHFHKTETTRAEVWF